MHESTERRPEGANDTEEDNGSGGWGTHAKRGFPGKLQVARSSAPADADEELIQAVAFRAHADNRDPVEIWDELLEGVISF